MWCESAANRCQVSRGFASVLAVLWDVNSHGVQPTGIKERLPVRQSGIRAEIQASGLAQMSRLSW